jgi:membrane fusion protein (multidrug efflux system)
MRSSLAIAGLAAVLCGCAGEDRGNGRASAAAAPAPTAAPEPAPVSTGSSPAPSETDAVFETALAPLHDVEVFARAAGEIMVLDVDEGRRVTAGLRLAQIDDRERRTTLEEREAIVARSEAAWRRAERLHEQKLISEEQWIAARADWQIARSQRDRAKLELERCAVRSPIRGVVQERRVQIGQTVAEGDLLFRVGDPAILRAELLLPEARLGSVRAGQPVTITPAAGPARLARVTRVNPLVDPASGTFRVVIDLDNRDGALAGGVSARVAFGPAAPPGP